MAGPVHAAPDEDPRRERALRLANEGRCEAALPELDAARLDAPDDAELAYRAGQCRLRLHRYEEAGRDLEGAFQLAPARPELGLALAKARYHAGDYAGAEIALDEVAPALPDDAEVWLYGGMLELERGELTAATRSLERARALDEATVEPIASYYLGVAHAQALDVDRAAPALQRVSDAWRGTDWSTRAQQRLRDLRAGRARQVWVAAGAGFEHDSNVVLRGRGTPLPDDISDDDDQRGVWTANAGIELWKTSMLTFGAMTSYRGTTHIDLHEFDAHFPSITTWLDVDLAEGTRGTARYDFGYAWLDGDPFLASNSWQLSLLQSWPDWGASEVFGRATIDDYFIRSEDVGEDCQNDFPCGPAGLNERREQQRSGWGLAAGFGHSLPIATGDLPLAAASVRGGYDYGYFDAWGREYSHQSHEFELGVSAELPLEFVIDASGSYAHRPFRHASTFPEFPPLGSPYTLSGKKRRDNVYEVQTSVGRTLTENLSAEVSWRFTDSDSNTQAFDYDQHVLGIHFTVGFGREL